MNFIAESKIETSSSLSSDENVLNLFRRFAEQLFWVLIIAGMNSLVQLLVDRDDDVEGSFLHGCRMIRTLQQINLGKNQHFWAFDESVEFVLLEKSC